MKSSWFTGHFLNGGIEVVYVNGQLVGKITCFLQLNGICWKVYGELFVQQVKEELAYTGVCLLLGMVNQNGLHF